MSLAALLNRPCLITHRVAGATRDEYNNEIPTEVTVSTVCELQQMVLRVSESVDEIAEAKWRLFLPAGTHIGSADTVTVDGEDFEVHGDPWPARNPRTQVPSHIEATVTRRAASQDAGGQS